MQTNVPSAMANSSVKPYKVGAFEEYVSFCALGGILTSEDGALSRMTVSEFCQQFGIDRKTAYRWRHTVGFNERVNKRRTELFPMARETAMWNRLYLIGMQSRDLKAAVDANKLLLGHFSGLRLPAKQQRPISNQHSWADLVEKLKRIENEN